MSGEFTLAELSKIEKDDKLGRILDTLLWEGPLFEFVPWESTGTLSKSAVRLGSLPSVGFRNINGSFSVTSGSLETVVEQVFLMGGDFDVDVAIARASNTIEAARTLGERMHAKAMAYKYNDKFINGSPITDPKEFTGLERRVDTLYSDGYTGQLIDVGGASVTEGILNSSTTMSNFIDKLDALVYAIKGHNPDVLLMNHKVLLAIRHILREKRWLDTTKDMFDRVVDQYHGARLIDVGVTANQTTEVIAENETKGGGTTECSIYAVKFGIGETFWGIQQYPMEARDLGELQTAPVYRTRVDWHIGHACVDPYSIARLYGIIASNAS